ncbi:hypothetical protein COP2_030882 [Malus domestica]
MVAARGGDGGGKVRLWWMNGYLNRVEGLRGLGARQRLRTRENDVVVAARLRVDFWREWMIWEVVYFGQKL